LLCGHVEQDRGCVTAPAAPSLTLADLDQHDPRARADRVERDYLCPLPACASKQRGARHRSLSVNIETGRWLCHRCGAHGVLGHASAPGSSDTSSRPQRPSPPPELLHLLPITAESPAYSYLEERRGLDPALAVAAGTNWCVRRYGRPWLAFPVRDRLGHRVAHQLRQIDGERHFSVGPKGGGVFITAPLVTILAQPAVPIVEAPIDALSLAAAGLHAIATCGKGCPDWLPSTLVGRLVLLGHDRDEPDALGRRAGDDAAEALARLLHRAGARPKRWRPPLKDWNQVLLEYSVAGVEQAIRAALPS
jgi:hypothetical protein